MEQVSKKSRGVSRSSILLTQCLQHDYLDEEGSCASNVFVGVAESRRVRQPLLDFVAKCRNDKTVKTVHIRDWHHRERDKEHLSQFGEHCLQDTKGAELIVGVGEGEVFVNGRGLNDFLETELKDLLEELLIGEARVALVGCWSEAKVSFLLYELATRGIQVAVSSALCAGSTFHAHYEALQRTSQLLKVPVFHGVSDLFGWLTFSGGESLEKLPEAPTLPKITLDADFGLSAEETLLVKLCFREATQVHLLSLSGGYSGARVYRAVSRDSNGRDLYPVLLKTGKRDSILKERVNSLLAEKLLGSNAPRVLFFADSTELAAVVFSFAALLSSDFNLSIPPVRTLESVWHDSKASIEPLLDTLTAIIKRVSSQAQYIPFNIFGKDRYDFDGTGWAWKQGGSDTVEKVAERIEKLLPGQSGTANELVFPGNRRIPNPILFLGERLKNIVESQKNSYHLVALVHGDCHFRNVLVDAKNNVFLVDFEFFSEGPLLKDVAKLESDLLYVHSNVSDCFRDALDLSDRLFAIQDLREGFNTPLDSDAHSPLSKTISALKSIRSCAAILIGQHGRSVVDMLWAKLRYALHAMTFSYLGDDQRRWALYDVAMCCNMLNARKRYSLEQYPLCSIAPNLVVAAMPGRVDRSSSLNADLDSMKKQGVSVMVLLGTETEIIDGSRVSLSVLSAQCATRGIRFLFFQTESGQAPSLETISVIRQNLPATGVAALISMQGLGRACCAAACLIGPDWEKILVSARGDKRVLDSSQQRQFVEQFFKINAQTM